MHTKGGVFIELNEFIKNILLNIKNGIEDANNEIGGEIFRLQPEDGSDLIDFDVAVTVESNNLDSSGANIGIVSVLGINIGGKRENANSSITTSRIKFKVANLLIK